MTPGTHPEAVSPIARDVSAERPRAADSPHESATGGRFGPGSLALPATLLLGALAARLLFVFVLPLQIQWQDARELEALGRLLYSQGTYGMQTLRPPGYPTLIAGVYHLFGPNLLALRVVEAVLATVAVALIGHLGARLFGRTAGLIAMALAAFHPMLAFLPSTQYGESTTVIVMALTLGVAYGALERGGWWRWALAGVLLGAQTLIRPNAIMMLPGLGLGFSILLHRRRRDWVVPLAITALAYGLVLAPWMVRGHAVHHRWYFIATGGGRQLWLGNNPSSTGLTSQDPFDLGELNRIYTGRDAFEQDEYFRQEAVHYMREHPGRAASLYLLKLRNIFALFPDTVSRTYVNSASQVTQGIASVVIFAGVLLGLRRWRAEPAMWPMVLGSLTFVLVTSLVFSSMRYRMFFEPCLILIAGVGWASVWPRRPALRHATPPATTAR